VSDYDAEEELMVYLPLMKKLRTMASRAGLSNVELLQEFEVYMSMRDSATSAMRGWEHENPGKTGWLRVGAVSGSADFTGKLRISTLRLRGSHFVF
jgi:hypothetical protein